MIAWYPDAIAKVNAVGDLMQLRNGGTLTTTFRSRPFRASR
jgi:hypothetical protein